MPIKPYYIKSGKPVLPEKLIQTVPQNGAEKKREKSLPRNLSSQSPFNPFFIPFKGKKIKKSLALITEKMYNLSRQNAAWITLNTFIRWWFRHDYADAYRSRALKKTYF